ncbi:MPP_superfamily domain containing protein [uncultured Caudovirales phage]|uniref:MPP_superfamily domain containing protein n=1 Tax=uncultured Caudovirales phage TaxID=2100421 RepID=A0A6J7WWM5_9CAUD|nr:MPP_superfamily domain containing protein [uncultured Caudovirales phage]
MASIKVCQTSDTHLGITPPKALAKMFRKMKEGDASGKEPFDVFLHNGDYCGGTNGARSVATTVKMFRELFPDKPFITNIGNHDYWYIARRPKGSVHKNPSASDFYNNLEKIGEVFTANNVHFLDEDGPFRFNGFTFVGHSGWYAATNPATNDAKYLPHGLSGHTHANLQKTAMNGLERNLSLLNETDINVAFSSHFPVIGEADDIGLQKYGGLLSIGDHMQAAYNCRFFFCGHAHQYHDGPLRYECGPDYGKPAYKIWTLEGK